MDDFTLLNTIYEKLYKKTQKISNALIEAEFASSWGFYGFHSVKRDGEFATEYFPIPVITIENICDIGIDLEKIFIEVVINREKAVEYNYLSLSDYDFEVYGAEDYLMDFFNEGLDLGGIGDRIADSKEDKICITINLDINSDDPSIINIIKMITLV